MRNKLGIVGMPLGHSISPFLHNLAIEKLNVELTYDKWEIEEDKLSMFISSVKDEDSRILGFNVTIPYKEKIIPLLDEIDPLARKLNAINTVKYENGILKGYNTDGMGFLESLIRNQIEYRNKNVLVLGSGGAANGIARYLAEKNVREIDIAARNIEKGTLLSDDIGSSGKMSRLINWNDLETAGISNYDIIVQTTPLGMKNHTPALMFPYEQVTKKNTVIDIVYNPLETEFLRNCKKSGAKSLRGLEMLVYQAYHSFKIWTGLEEDTELMLKAAIKLMEEQVE